jgi:hypothetical protein
MEDKIESMERKENLGGLELRFKSRLGLGKKVPVPSSKIQQNFYKNLPKKFTLLKEVDLWNL